MTIRFTKAIKKVSDDIEDKDTAIATLMALLNDFESAPTVGKEQCHIPEAAYPFAPHIAEELWESVWRRFPVRLEWAGLVMNPRW